MFVMHIRYILRLSIETIAPPNEFNRCLVVRGAIQNEALHRHNDGAGLLAQAICRSAAPTYRLLPMQILMQMMPTRQYDALRESSEQTNRVGAISFCRRRSYVTITLLRQRRDGGGSPGARERRPVPATSTLLFGCCFGCRAS
uniref:Uncharacterized protein n=1 Tax=Plectus sambesii TaxID=2011161 RepID=A0A914WNT5_9BILA